MASIIRSELLLTLLAGAVGGAVVAVPVYWGTNREMDVKMVEIAVGILSQEPKENIAPAREWAVDVISHYAEVKPSDQVRAALIENKVVSGYLTGGYEPYYTYGGYVPPVATPKENQDPQAPN